MTHICQYFFNKKTEEMKFLNIFLIIFLFKESTQNLIDKNLKFTVDFLDESKSNLGIVFYCNDSLKINMWQELMDDNFKYFSFFDISKMPFNESAISSIMTFNYYKLAIICDLTCNEIEEFFKITSELNFFNASYNWLMMSNNYNASTAILSRQNINLDSEITLAILSENYQFDLFDVFNPSYKYGGKLIVTPKGTYTSQFKIKDNFKSKFQRRSDLKGIKINAGIVATAVKKGQILVEYLESDENPLIDAQHRHHYRLFKILAEKHNFSFFLHRGALWGLYRNQSYNGILGMYQTGQIDFSITPFRVTPDRLDMMHFSVTTWITTPTIIFRHPRNSHRSPFLEPLSPWVWNFILIITFIVSILVTITIRCKRPMEMNMTLIRALMTVHGIMCQQGFMENFNRSSTRLILLIFIFFSQIIYQFYSSFIVGSLLTDPPKTINTLRQLIDSNLKVGIEDVTYIADFFQTSNDTIAQEFYKKKVLNGPSRGKYYPIEKGLKLLRQGGYAFHFDTSYGYRMITETFSEDEICELHQMLIFAKRPLSVTVAKHSPFKELIMVEMLKLSENGILSYFDSKWQSKKPRCVKSVTKVKAIDIDDASWVFIMLSFSILMSFFIMLCENLHYWIFYKKNLSLRKCRIATHKPPTVFK